MTPLVRRRRRVRELEITSTVGKPPPLLAMIVKIVMTALYLIPLLWIVIAAFKSNTEILIAPNALIFRPTLDTLRTVLGEAGGSVLLSLEVTASATLAVLVVGIPAAYALARRTSAAWGRVISVVLTLLLVLQMVPQPMTVIPLYGVLASWHLLGSDAGLIVADTALVLPFSIVLLRPFVLTIPEPLFEAAALDGANGVQTFRRIVLPLLTNGIATVTSIVFIIVWGEFIYASNFITLGATFPVSALLAQQISTTSASWNTLMALALLTSLPLLAVFLFAQRRLTAGISLGAVK
jgi:ABC-type glycerol-3-phosphate transport system permease component